MSLSIGSFTTRYTTEWAATSVIVSPTILSSDVTTETVSTAVIVSPVLISSDVTITVTSRLASTIFATIGQTVTIPTPSSIAVPSVVAPTTKYTPSPLTATDPIITTTVTSTVIFTELDLYFQNTAGSVFSTQAIPYTPFLPPNPTTTQDPGLVYVLHPSGNDNDGGWDDWSKGERVGLIIGVIFGACLLFAILWYLCLKPWKGAWWFAHGQPVGQAPVIGTPAPNFVQPGYVNGPVVPYGYQQGYGYGLRGGEGKDRGKRLFSGRNWFSVQKQERTESGVHAEEGSEAGTVRRHGRRVASGKNWFSTSRKADVSGGRQDVEAINELSWSRRTRPRIRG